MDPARLADIRAGTDTLVKKCGSGYLIGPRLVLTARHVVADDAGDFPRIQVRLGHPRHTGAQTSPILARVCWQHPDLDVALLRLERPTQAGTVRWGRLTGTEPVTYSGMGFPRFARYDDTERGIEQLGGTIRPWSTGPGGCHVLDQDAAPEPHHGRYRDDPDHHNAKQEDRLWPGASGTAVLHGGLVLGVMILDDRLFGNKRLHARPVHDFVTDEEFASLVRADTGISPITEPVELAGLTDVITTDLRKAPAETPGSLLAAAAEVVRFHPRPDMLDRLTTWRDDPTLHFSVALITAEGGQGKTRLAREFARTTTTGSQGETHLPPESPHNVTRPDWAVAFTVKPPPQPLSDDQHRTRAHRLADRARTLATPVLVICDYAEAHPGFVDALIEALSTASPTHPVRVLLLARTPGAWWTGITDLLGEPAAPHWPLPPLGDTETDRHDLYRAAVTDLAEALPNLPQPAIGHPPRHPWPRLAADLSTTPPTLPSTSANALTLQMTALLDLLHAATGQERTLTTRPEHQLVVHERDYLKRVAATCGLFDPGVLSTATSPHVRHRQSWHALERCVAALILLGPCDTSTARSLAALATPSHPGPGHTGDILYWLGSLYPPPNQSLALGHIQPDRLAEHLLGDILTPPPAGEPFRPDHTGLPAEIAALVNDLETAQSSLFTLIRTATHPPFTDTVTKAITDVITTHPDPFATAAPLLAVASGHRSLLLPGLQALATDNPEALSHQISLANDLLPDTSISLARFNTTVTEVLTTLYRDLTGLDRDAYLPGLAGSLNNYGIRLADIGQHTEAVPVSEEAVRLNRELTRLNRDVHLPDLAGSLNNLANRLAETGRRTEALPVSEEAVRLNRELTRLDRDTYLPGLAMSLNTYATALAETGRSIEAVPVSEEAVRLRRELTLLNRDAYLPKLAISLNTHTNVLSGVGRNVEAIPVSEEAVSLYRQLTEINSDAYLPDLAMALHNHANILAQIGRHSEALPISEEDVNLSRELTRLNRDAYLPSLALSLHTQANILAQIGRLPEALLISEEALDLYRELTRLNRDAYLPHLAGSLNTHANVLALVGQHPEALSVSEESIGIRRELLRTNHNAYLPDLASSLNNHAISLAEAGHQLEALRISKEAVRLYRKLTRLNRNAYLPELVRSLRNHAIRLTSVGLRHEAKRISEEVTRLRREVARLNRNAYLADHTQSLMMRAAEQLRDAYGEDVTAFRETFRKITGQDIPAWLEEAPPNHEE
ncbi:hypothetical protein GCM10009677_15260 [Sphaerisporangium rubeum]|uniref:Tetratricopeptide (TPR) repeat protein n=1 Tax=Sphaerisporangium rubeum TaxID=321317 RepID=A0A7X0I9S0_9ACTN|nr:tetratricopeptide repeat protein [Sphaerisporangium rubeum]MBB6471085.1 tetratricopeptide (TPR) repeat protein [Sphaerisporangium rubeum]